MQPEITMPKGRYFKGHYFSGHFARGVAIALVLYFAAIPIKLVIARSQVPYPQAILVLGGSAEREVAAAHLALQDPAIEVWVSTGENFDNSVEIFKTAGINFERLHLDWQAVDTVTNFTTTVDQFTQRDIRHIYLITSDFHMRRARAIAFFVLGSRGITYTSLEITSKKQPETLLHAIRDTGRSILWLATGRTGASAKNLIPKKDQ